MTGVMGHPGVADAIRSASGVPAGGHPLASHRPRRSGSALRETCTLSIGSGPPYLPSIHVHTNDLRASLAELTRRLTNYPPQALPAVDSTCPTESSPTHPSWTGHPVARRDHRARCGAARRRGHRCRRGQHRSGSDPICPRGAQAGCGGARDGRHGIHLRRRRSAWRSLGGRRTVIVAGDGAFFMHGMEIHTAIQHRLPVTFVLFNNNAHAMCVTREQLFYEGITATTGSRPADLAPDWPRCSPDCRQSMSPIPTR